MMSRLVITFLPRSKCLLISWLQSSSAVIWEPPKIKPATVSTVSPSISYEMMGPDAMILVFQMLSFKLTLSHSSFTFIKKLFNFSSLSAISIVASAYLRLLIFLLAILIVACASSSLAFHMMYPATSNAEEAEVEQFYEDLQDLLERTPKKDVLFIIGDWNAKLGSPEISGVTGIFGLGIRNEAGQRLIGFCQENALVIANTLFQQHNRRLYTWTSPDGQH